MASGEVCVGATPSCSAACYAKKGFFAYNSVQEALEKRYQISKQSDFADLLVNDIRDKFVRVVRIHASGEFYSADYVDKWRKIVTSCPKVRFFAYTRSWRNREILASLRRLAALKNFQMWFSADAQTGSPPKVSGVKVAYMKGEEHSGSIIKSNLIFRIKRKSVEKKIGNVLVCPAENGATKMTCSRCQLCFNPQKLVKLS